METSHIIITGVNGFVGYHLAKELHNQGIIVIGIGREEHSNLAVRPFLTTYYSADLTANWPDAGKAHAIIHLAGLAAVGPSFDNPQQYINDNSSMVTNMYEYYLKQDKKPRIIIVSSGAIYDTHQPMPITESSTIGFSSPYAVSKINVENQAAYYRNRGIEGIIVRPFNHIGPGQSKGFIIPDFFERLANASDGEIIKVGNIASRRDYTDVRDIVDAYIKLAIAPSLSNTLYNLCSGVSISGEDIFTTLKTVMKKQNVTFEIDPEFIRPTDAMEIVGDSSRIQKELNWHPTYSIEHTIKDFVTSLK